MKEQMNPRETDDRRGDEEEYSQCNTGARTKPPPPQEWNSNTDEKHYFFFFPVFPSPYLPHCDIMHILPVLTPPLTRHHFYHIFPTTSPHIT